MLAAIQLTAGPKIRLSQWELNADSNAAVAEGVAWMKGRLDLPPAANNRLLWDYPAIEGDPAEPQNRLHDTAYSGRDGKIYNVFPPLMTFLTVALYPIHHMCLGLPDGVWTPWFYTLLVFWPLPIIGFVVFRRQMRNSAWAAFMTLAWLGGTAVLPNLHDAQSGLLGQIDHILSQIGLLILAADLLGRQRIWPALIGLAIATYSRQITFLYGLPLLWVAWRHGRRRLAFCMAGLGIVAAPLLALNQLKFGNPLNFGYQYIYVGRESGFLGRRVVRHGLFNPRFILGAPHEHGNAYYMHIAPPRIDWGVTQINISEGNSLGTSIWITTPLLFIVFISARCWWRDKSRRILVLGTLPVMLGLLCYHSPGFLEGGYNRFALDFVPIWLLVFAPYVRGGWRTWFTLGCTAWSLLYFQAVVPDVSVRYMPTRTDSVSMVIHEGL